MHDAIKKAEVLIEALPYIKRFQRRIFIIKYGGSILGEEKVRKSVLEDIVFLRYAGIRPIIVHGGGPNISEALKRHKIPVKFIDGLRVTDKNVLRVVTEELNELNDMIVKEINSHGVMAQGFKVEDELLIAVKKTTKVDLGLVGEVVDVDVELLGKTVKDAIPVIAPLGVSKDGTIYNINADDAACFLAGRVRAEKLVLLTKVLGVMRDVAHDSSLIPTITSDKADDLIKQGIISQGMVPKVRAGVEAIKEGVGKIHIVDAKIPHALLLEIFTDRGIGTEIV